MLDVKIEANTKYLKATKWDREGAKEVNEPMYNISLVGIITMNPPCTMNIS
jgi:hypothetical protein